MVHAINKVYEHFVINKVYEHFAIVHVNIYASVIHQCVRKLYVARVLGSPTKKNNVDR